MAGSWLDEKIGIPSIYTNGVLADPRRQAIALVAGLGIALATVDDTVNERTQVTISATGGASGFDYKASARVATTAALAANTRTGNVLTANANGALASIDAVSLVVGDSVLVKNEATGANNGLYTVTSLGSVSTPWVLTRRDDSDTSAEVTAGFIVPIEEGTTNADTLWIHTTNGTITLNTTALTFSKLAPSAGGGTGHTIREESTPLTQRTNLSFIGTYVTATDNAGADSTDVTFSAIVNADVATGANIAVTKLALGAADSVLSSDGATNSFSTTPKLAAVRFGAGPASAGRIRFSHGDTVQGLNQAGGADRTIFDWGVAANDVLRIGDASNVETRLVSAGDVTIYRGATANLNISSPGSNAILDFLGATGDAGIFRAGQAIIGANASGTTRNAFLFGTPSGYNSGDRVTFWANRTAAPTAIDAGGAYLFAESGGMRIVGSHLAVGLPLSAGIAGTGEGIRLTKNGGISVRNAADSGDLDMLRCNASAAMTVGNSTLPLTLNGGGSSLALQINGTQRIALDTQVFGFHPTNIVDPIIRQNDDSTNSITGDTLTIQAQNATGTTTTGGTLNLTGGSGTTAHGGVRIAIGNLATTRIQVNATGIGVFGVTPVARVAAYTPTNVTPDRSFDADTVAVAELADVVGTIIADLQSYGWFQ